MVGPPGRREGGPAEGRASLGDFLAPCPGLGPAGDRASSAGRTEAPGGAWCASLTLRPGSLTWP
eukprot:8644720-Alexandrium_andersonii.AAC.1